jgi:adenylate cyclase
MTYDIADLQSPEDVRALFRLNASVDALVEEAQRRRWALSRAMESILPAVATMLSARAFAIRTYGEDLELHDYGLPDGKTDKTAGPLRESILAALDAHTAEAEGESTRSERAGRICVSQRLDVAGEWFGAACLIWEKDAESAENARDPSFLTAALEVVCEELDGFLFGIRAAREKHRVMMALAHALQSPVLGEGLADAARVLFSAAPVSKLLLAVLAEDSPDAPVHLQVYDETGCTLDRIGQPTGEASLLDEASAYLFSGDDTLLERLGFRGAREEVLINGVSGKALVGKVLVVSPSDDWGTHDRELLAGFADFIRQRVVDFSKEYKVLARSFRPADVNRLLSTRDYHERWLSPREANVAMLYADIAGFTRLCETVLGDPSRIGALVDAWGHDAVELVWRHGGVFDKMVGDCVIGLFGPPFYEGTERDHVANALAAAQGIREMTAAFSQRAGFEVLQAHGFGVSTGVNFAPLFVGPFGPNANFTGFSSGMNNTARLQAQAKSGEILVMESARRLVAEDARFAFGEPRRANVKNVAQPLVFHALTS